MRSTITKSMGWLLFLFVAIIPIQAQQAAKPVFNLDFSDGSTAVNGQGRKVPSRVAGQFTVQDSPHGKAMLSGPGAGYLHFPAKDIINSKEGTVEMWVCPQDWDGSEEQFHVFFDARGQGALYLYKYFQRGSLLMLSAPAQDGPYFSASADVKSWKPGEWHFIVGSWSESELSIYVDGKLMGVLPRPSLPESISGEFEIGDAPWSEPIEPRKSRSLVANVRIYNRTLSAEHIAAHYASDYDKVVPLSSKTLSLNVSPAALTRQLNVSLNTGGADINRAAAQVDFSLRKNGKVLQKLRTQKLQHYTARGSFDLEKLAPGNYQVLAHVSVGAQKAQISQDVAIPDLSWMGNTLGEEDRVLPPWTPMQVKTVANGADVSCWGRIYQFRDAPLPTQILSQDQPMLDRPIGLKVLSGTQELQWRDGSVKVLKSSPTHVVLQGSATAETPLGKVVLTTNIRLEYDGLATLSLRMQKPHGWQPDAVSLEMPLHQKNALYYHRASSAVGGALYSPAGLIPEGNGVVDKTPFRPFSWQGDDSRGLFWFCETAQFWPNWQDENALQIVRDDNSVSIQVNLVKGQKISDDWTYDCGIQATPVKAIPADWRKWRFEPAPRAKVKIVWPRPFEVSLKHYGYPEAADDKAFLARIKELRARGEVAVPYSALTFVSSASPEYRWFEKDWDTGLHDGGSPDVMAYKAPFNSVSMQQETLQDFLIWKNSQFMKQFGLGGYYHDLSYPYSATVAAAGYGWLDGDKRYPTYKIMATRNLYRRLYAVTKAQNPNAFLMGHMSGSVTIPFLGYEDAVLNGEQFGQKVQDSYMDVMSLAEWRAVFTGRQWGVMGYFLPMLEGKYATDTAPTRGLAALLMLHDVSPWVLRGNPEEWNSMYDALDKFGYVDSTFIPYWSPQSPAATDMKDVYISAYKRKDGRALLVVGNTSREPRSGAVTLNAASLGLPVGTVLSWPGGTPLPNQNGKVQVNMEGLDYRLLLIEKSPVQ